MQSTGTVMRRSRGRLSSVCQYTESLVPVIALARAVFTQTWGDKGVVHALLNHARLANSSTLFFTPGKFTTGVKNTVCTAVQQVLQTNGNCNHGARRQWAGGGCGHGGKANNRAPRLAEKRWLQSRAHMQRLVVQLLGMLLEDTELWARCARRE